jgi:hypothetical protein
VTLAALPQEFGLRACPFCRGHRLRLHEWRHRGEQFRVQCLTPQCEAQGPRRYDADEALAAWNDQA